MNRSHPFLAAIALLLLNTTLGGCKSPKGYTVTEQRESVQQMRADALSILYADKPGVKAHLEAAPGYAVFSNYGMKIIFVGSGNGFGVVHDKAANTDTYMKMFELNVGVGIGLKNYRIVMVFNNPATMKEFINSGWEFGGSAQAAAKLKHDGAEAGAAGTVNDIDIYILTKTGIDLSATVDGTKYSRDDKLNSGAPGGGAGGSGG